MANQVLGFYVFSLFNILVQVTIWESACACTRVVPIMLLNEAPKSLQPFVRLVHSPKKTRTFLTIHGIVTCILSIFVAIDATDFDMSHQWIALIEGIQLVFCAINAIFLSCSYVTIKKVLHAYMTSHLQNASQRDSLLLTVAGRQPNNTENKRPVSMSGEYKSLPRRTNAESEAAHLNKEIAQSRQRHKATQNDLLRVRLQFAFAQMKNNLVMNLLAFGINLFYVICSRNANVDYRYRVPIFVFVLFP